MKYEIKRLNRTVELNDELVEEYKKYDVLRDAPFSIAVRTRYGHAPAKDEISDKELSEFCNNVLLAELKAFTLLPGALKVVTTEDYTQETKDGKLMEYQL